MKFRINWGTGIVIAFVLFIGFIMYFVVLVNTDSSYDHDLVTEEYYKKELDFQHMMEKEKRAQKEGMEVTWNKAEEGILLRFPDKVVPAGVTGKIYFYRPSNKKLDFEVPLAVQGSTVLVPGDKLVEGRWNITVDWQYEGAEYLTTEEIRY
ncbi:FixH family protein [Robertkochia solimangrovi]|uniref:FixH family protein n=1 Tax=Robertkochia solimangrovi TaxID=2213046 RepID=UPI00117EEAE1|nr:FixH family protein [Robertkochia solimangrovi]TRZ46477.1 cytochrome C oxidase Cbb3 [Robertkochia solimangrovi]